MSQLVTIATFNHSSEYAVLKSHLEAEGIETMVTNATSGDILSIYGIGTSPIQLKVLEKDVERSCEIMRSHGFVENLNQQSPIVREVGNLADRIPLIRKLSPGIRFLIVTSGIITILVVIIYFIFLAG